MALRLHREGKATLTLVLWVSAVLLMLFYWFAPDFLWIPAFIGGFFFLFFLQFFRYPERKVAQLSNDTIVAPADGTIVSIEKTMENEYFQEEKLLISIFMSVTNVHANSNPINGQVAYYKYHEGKFLAAWNPKSSTENERTTVVYTSPSGTVMARQIAGLLARRIVNYLKQGQQVTQGSEMGFIKLGSRVDLFLPLDAKLNIEMNQKVKANETIIAYFN